MKMTKMDRPRLRWYFLCLPSLLKPSRNCQDIKRNRRILSTMEISVLMRLSPLLDRGGTHLLVRELSGAIKEILGTTRLSCDVDGRHPHGIIDDLNSGTVECSAS